MRPSHFFKYLFLASAAAFLASCAGTQKSSEKTVLQNQIAETSSAVEQSSSSAEISKSDEKANVSSPVENAEIAETAEVSKDSTSLSESASDSSAQESRLVLPNVAEVIPLLLQNAFSRADSFYTAQSLDSSSAILDRFSVLNPLWEEWQTRALALQTQLSKNAESLEKDSTRQKENLCDFEKGAKLGFDIYIEIPKRVQLALNCAEELVAVGQMDSATVEIERFLSLNSVWQEMQKQSKALSDSIRAIRTRAAEQKMEALRVSMVNLVNANLRNVSYSELKALADSVLVKDPGDSLTNAVNSILQKSYAKNFEKGRTLRDSALALASEKADFDDAEKLLNMVALRYSEFADTLQLPQAILRISSLRSEESPVPAEYWNSHDPQKEFENAKKQAAAKQWNLAKESLQKLKSSSLRGESLREMDVLFANFCTEARTQAATLFAKSKQKKANKAEVLAKAIEQLDHCLEFAPTYKDRATVENNKKFLQTELSK